MYYFGNNQNYDSKLISMDVYEFKNFLPRLYFTKNIKSLKKSKIYDKIIKDDFNPEIISYLDKKVLEINKSFDLTFRESIVIPLISVILLSLNKLLNIVMKFSLSLISILINIIFDYFNI